MILTEHIYMLGNLRLFKLKDQIVSLCTYSEFLPFGCIWWKILCLFLKKIIAMSSSCETSRIILHWKVGTTRHISCFCFCLFILLILSGWFDRPVGFYQEVRSKPHGTTYMTWDVFIPLVSNFWRKKHLMICSDVWASQYCTMAKQSGVPVASFFC